MPRRLLIILSLAALALGAAACDEGNGVDTGAGTATPTETGEPTPDATDDGTTTAQSVTVTGTVDEVLADQAFTLSDPSADADDGTATISADPLPVIVTNTTGETDVAANATVTVTGTLHDVDLAEQAQELEDSLGITIDESVVSQVDAQQVLLATSVSTDTTG